MTTLSKIKSHSDAVNYFKGLPFYNKPIEKRKVKRLKKVDRLVKLPIYEQLSVIKTNDAFNPIQDGLFQSYSRMGGGGLLLPP